MSKPQSPALTAMTNIRVVLFECRQPCLTGRTLPQEKQLLVVDGCML